MLDLSALEEKIAPVDAQSTGKPLELPIEDVEEDEGQPRKEFSKEKMAEMTASIKLRGVRQPVSVRPHPDKPGKWLLNFGARRLRGSKLAGKTTIPAFVDDASDDFDQVIENENRDNLKPMELALFIKGKLDQGVKKAEIARRLTRPASAITELLALIDAPNCIEQAYRSGRCTSPKTLYELRMLHGKFAQQVQAWCEQTEEITRKGVAELSAQLKERSAVMNDSKVNDASTGTAAADIHADHATENLSHDKENRGDVTAMHRGVSDEQGVVTSESRQKFSGSDLTSWPSGSPPADTGLMKKPLLIVEHEGKTAVVLLNRRPSAAGMIHIRYEDRTEDAEVDAAALKISLLTENEKIK